MKKCCYNNFRSIMEDNLEGQGEFTEANNILILFTIN